MIEVMYQDGRFLVRGSFSMGLAGVYENKEFGETNLVMDASLEEIRRDLESPFYFQPLQPYFGDGSHSGEAVAKGLEAYYREKEREAQRNLKQINDCLWFHLFFQLENCAYPFWNIKEAILPGALEGYEGASLEKEIYALKKRVCDEYQEDTPNNGTVLKPDVEGALRKQYPMFHFDGLYQAILPQGLYFHGRFLEFQFSDRWGGELFESAYARFDETFTLCEWSNH